jgi:hypothetical protein
MLENPLYGKSPEEIVRCGRYEFGETFVSLVKVPVAIAKRSIRADSAD